MTFAPVLLYLYYRSVGAIILRVEKTKTSLIAYFLKNIKKIIW